METNNITKRRGRPALDPQEILKNTPDISEKGLSAEINRINRMLKSPYYQFNTHLLENSIFELIQKRDIYKRQLKSLRNSIDPRQPSLFMERTTNE